MKGCWDFVQGAACCSKSGKCTGGISFTPVHTYESCRKDVSGPDSSDGGFFQKLGRQGEIQKFVPRFFSVKSLDIFVSWGVYPQQF